MVVILITVAFLAGMAVRKVGLPPMVGFLIAGFILRATGNEAHELLPRIADFGVTLLLFTIGLKLEVRSLLRPEVWAGTTIHMAITSVLLGALALGLGACGLPLFNQLSVKTALIVGFALSFSSTVFAAKVFEDRAELATRHAAVAIGILIMQDVIAVVFLTLSKGEIPSPWAFGLLILPLFRPVLQGLLARVGRGELLLLFGFVMTFAGVGLFEAVGLKGDLGAIAFGMILATSPRSSELARNLFGFKDIFLVAFFLSIGLSDDLRPEAVLTALILLPLMIPKALGFYAVLCAFRLRARPSFFAAVGLANYSEFGLIVGSVAVSAGWLSSEWLVALAVLVGLSFCVSAPLNTSPSRLFNKFHHTLRRWERKALLPEDKPIKSTHPDVIIFGMGRVGTGAYDWLVEHRQLKVVGVDSDPDACQEHLEAGRNVIFGDGTDPGFWERVDTSIHPKMVIIATRNYRATQRIAKRLVSYQADTRITALVKHPDEAEALERLGIHSVYDLYLEAGTSFAAESWHALEDEKTNMAT